MPSVLIVVLNWNGADDTIECVSSLVKMPKDDYSILVIDNDSEISDFKKLDAIRSNPKLKIIRNRKNLGFAGGVNTGIRYAIQNDYELVALFNNDAVVDPNWLQALKRAFSVDSSILAVTGLLLHKDGKTIDTTGDYYSIWGMPFPRSRGQHNQAAPDSGYVFGATGGATLYKTLLFKEIGLFDETFFAYYEDVDISFRAQLAGYKVYYTKDAIAYHKQGATSSKIPGFTVYQTFKNIPLLYAKNVPLGLLLPVGIRLFVLYWLIFVNAIKNGTGKYALKGWSASIWYFGTKALWNRFYIQSRKKVSSRSIKDLLWPSLPPEQTGIRKLLSVFIKDY